MTDRQYKQFSHLYSKGYNDVEIAKKMCVSQSTVQKWRKKYKMKANWEPNGKNSPSKTICWDCQNAVYGCSWSKHFVPVEGWDATPTMLYAKDKAHGGVQSYEVHRCPQYVPDGRADG